MSNFIKVPFCKPFVNDFEVSEVKNTILNGWLTTGKISMEVERMIAEYTGAKHCVLLTSATAALHLSLEYIKRFVIKKDLKVYVPSLTFVSTASEVIHAGGKVIFGDVDDTLCLNPASKKDFNAVIPVHLTGVKAYTDYVCPVIEDSAHLIEKDQCKDNPNFVCYSFYATKNLTMGEGGAICVNNQEAADWFRKASHHGISKDGWKRYESLNNWQYEIEFVGWKYNPSDVLAAILKQQFGKLEIIQKERQRCVDIYNLYLGNSNKGLHLYPVLVSDRSKFIRAMADEGIQCSVHFLPLHKMKAFENCKKDDLHKTEYYGKYLVSLPLFPSLTNNEIETICTIAKKTGLLINP